MKKTAIAIFMTALFLVSILAPLISTANAADPSSWYMTVNGNLSTDAYSLYPYAKSDLKVGMSKFGELIDNNLNVGLEYAGARDPFAPLAGLPTDDSKLPKYVWINGWYLDFKYIHAGWGLRDVWAGAMFADLSSYAGPWLRVDNGYSGGTETAEDFTDPGKPLDDVTGDLVAGGVLANGGRKTNGTVITDPIQVLYDGPREFIAIVRNHLYDWYEPTNIKLHILDLFLTIRFDKVKKEVTVLKDVKLIDQAKFQLDPLPVVVDGKIHNIPYGVVIQLSDRDEWDLGLDFPGTSKYSSYVHFYTQGTQGTVDPVTEGQSTCYNNDWTANPTLPGGYQIANWPGIVWSAWGSEPKSAGTYDVAQVISNDLAYVGWAAFWPSCSDWSADAGGGRRNVWWTALNGTVEHDIDSYLTPNDEPFVSPLTVGEWDAALSDTARDLGENVYAYPQFRGVTKYGVTDLHNGRDDDEDGVHGEWSENIIDREVQYQLDENFNPWDLYSAVEKKTRRWVEWTTAASYTTLQSPVIDVSSADWDQYCEFSERVLLGSTLLKRGVDYSFSVDANGHGVFTGMPSGTKKILYSTDGEWFSYDRPTWTRVFNNIALDDTSPVTLFSTGDLSQTLATDPLGATWSFFLQSFAMRLYNTTMAPVSFSAGSAFHINFDDLLVKKEQTAILRPIAISLQPVDFFGNGVNGSFSLLRYEISIEAPMKDDIQVIWAHPELVVSVTGVSNGTHLNATATLRIGGGAGYPYSDNDVGDEIYHERVGGRYEWGVVGRDSAAVDSAGLSLVSAAFKNKHVEYGVAGADMFSPLVDGNAYLQMPWVMSPSKAAPTARADYYYSSSDFRTALRDDWSRAGTVTGDEWPIASSNMIGIGGLYANLLAWYGNDFTDAFFGTPDFSAGSPYLGLITGIPCWNRGWRGTWNTYSSNNTVGYAVISTYKDINGTVIFLIWGNWGRDTYYVSKWFHEVGIWQLQEAPRGVTSIIVQIKYESTSEGYKPTVISIPEVLGTISERQWIHYREIKGGIHDP